MTGERCWVSPDCSVDTLVSVSFVSSVVFLLESMCNLLVFNWICKRLTLLLCYCPVFQAYHSLPLFFLLIVFLQSCEQRSPWPSSWLCSVVILMVLVDYNFSLQLARWDHVLWRQGLYGVLLRQYSDIVTILDAGWCVSSMACNPVGL